MCLRKQGLKNLLLHSKNRIDPLPQPYLINGYRIGLILLGSFYNFPHGRKILLKVFSN